MSFNLIGGKGGSSTFKSRPDTLRSNDSFELLLGLGSGRWKGLKNGLRSLEVNDVPLENEDGTSNFNDFAVIFADGDPAQTQLVNFKLGGGGGTTAVNTTIGNTNGAGTPGPWVTAAVSTPGADFIDIRLVISQLFYQDKKGIRENKASLEVEMRPSGTSNWINPLSSNAAPNYNVNGFPLSDGFSGFLVGYMLRTTWNDAGNAWRDPNPGYIVINDKTTSPSVKELRISVPNTGVYANKTWEVRIRLREPQSVQADPIEERRTIQWESIAAISKQVFGSAPEWRGLSWLQVVGKANEQISGVPSLRGIYETKIVKTPPSNIFNPDTRQYTSNLWDGSYTLNYTKDPAWCIKDLIEDSVSGIAALSPGASLDKWDALDASKYYSQLVPDGKGGTHPRFSMNIKLDQFQNTEDMIQYLAGAVNSLAVDSGDSKWRLKVDKPETPVALFTRDNIIGDVQYSHTDVDSRFNDVTVSFINSDNRYQEDRARVYDQAHIDRFGRKPTTIAAVGCNNRQEALRRAMFRLRVATRETRLITFTTNRQGGYIQPLNVILFADTDLAYTGTSTDNRTTSRIQTISGTTVTLGSNIRLEANIAYSINVTVPNPNYNPETASQPASSDWQKPTITITRNLVNNASQRGNTNTLYLDSALPANTPVNAPVGLSAVGLPSLPIQYRVVEVSAGEDGETYTIQALAIDTGKWDAMDNVNETAILGQISDTNVPAPIIPSAGLFSIRTFDADYQRKRVLTVNWERPASLFLAGFSVEYSLNNGPWTSVPVTPQQNYVEIQQPESGVYDFRIASIDRRERMSGYTVGQITISDTAEDYAPLHRVGLLINRPAAGLKEGEKYTTTDQNPNLTYIWNNGKWVEESNYVTNSTQVKYNDGSTLEVFKPADKGATVGGTIGTNIRNSDGTVFDPSKAGGGNTDVTPPGPPTNLAASSTVVNAGATLDITWTPPSDTDINHYNIEIAEGASGNFIGFVSSTARYSRTVSRNTLYRIRVQAVDHAGNSGNFTTTVSYTTAKDTVPPAKPTNLAVDTAFTTANIRWLNGNEDDLSHVAIYLYNADGSVLLDSSRKVSAAKGGGSYIWVNLAKATSYRVAVELFDTSGNPSGPTAQVSFTMAGGIDVNDFTPGLSGYRTVTSLPAVSGYTGPNVVFFNGKLYRLTGGAWTSGVDSTDIGVGTVGTVNLVDNAVSGPKIASDAIQARHVTANSVSTNKLVAASRPFSTIGIDMRVNADGNLQWSAGTVFYTDDAGNSQTKAVSGNLFGGAPGTTYHIIWNAAGAAGNLDYTTDSTYLALPGWKHVATWVAGSKTVVMAAGVGTLINGGGIVARTIIGESIKAQTISADNVMLGTLTAAQVATGALTARVIAIGDSTNLVPGDTLASYDEWTGTGSSTYSLRPGTGGYLGGYLAVPAQTYEQQVVSLPIPVSSALTYRASGIIVSTNGDTTARAHITWFSNADGTGYVSDSIWAANTAPYDGSSRQRSGELKPPTTAKSCRLVFSRLAGGTGEAHMAEPSFRVMSGATLIQNGAITTDHITVNTLNGDRLLIGSMDADRIKVRSINADRLSLGTLSRVLSNNIDTSFWGISAIDGTPGWSSNAAASNAWANGLSPNGGSETILKMTARDANGGPNGGWNVSFSEGFSPTKAYRYCTWVYNDANFPMDNSIFHGTGNADNVPGGNLGDINNPYFFSFQKSALPANKWFLMVGLVHPAGTQNGNSGISGVYDPTTGRRVIAGSDAQWRPNVISGYFRSYQFYGSNNGQAYFTKPIVEEYVAGQTASVQSLLQQMDYAQNINGGSTLIAPGKVLIQGAVSLDAWRDQTEIRGGAIKANSVSAEKLTINARGISTQDLVFRYSAADVACYWTGGAVFYIDDAGNRQITGVNAGGVGRPPAGRYYYIYWIKGANVLSASIEYSDCIGADRVHFATFTGNPNINQLFGGTVIHGTEINTGSINADRMNVAALSAITANIGDVTAGVVRSADDRTRLDLNSGRLTFSTGSFRSVQGAALGPNSNMILWFGPTSVAVGSETIANSRFAWSTDGKVYYGAAEVGSASRATQTVGLNTTVTKTLSPGESMSYEGSVFVEQGGAGGSVVAQVVGGPAGGTQSVLSSNDGGYVGPTEPGGAITSGVYTNTGSIKQAFTFMAQRGSGAGGSVRASQSYLSVT